MRQQEAAGDEAGWAQAQARARALLSELQERVRPLREPGYLGELRRKAEKARKRRLRLHKRKQEAEAAREEEAARAAEREARIDQWRAKCVQEVEEKTRERELKAAADSVLSEVRKKQADTKRMVDILRALEKLRKLRKEAAGRKGVCPPPSADEDFEHHIQKLRTLIRKRSELYEAEERALRVMLEGEQEEERKREMEKKQKKEREKLLQQKRDIDSKLFGDPDEFPLNHLLQPFRQYYLQAEHSVPALIQIRHEWDQYLVPDNFIRSQSEVVGISHIDCKISRENMSCLDDVPFKMPKSFEDDSAEGTNLISLADFDIPDCTEILMCTLHDFSLERKVLYWIEAASGQETPWYGVTTDAVPTAPPCWLLLVDPKENYVINTQNEERADGKAKDGVTHTTSVRRCVSLSAADVKYGPSTARGAPSETESEDWYSEENEYSEDDEYSSTTGEESNKEEENILDNKFVESAMPQHSRVHQFRPRTSPVLLDPPSENCCHEPVTANLIKQRRSMILFNNMKNELEEAKKKLAALVHPLNRASVERKLAPRPVSLYQRSRSSRNLRYGPASDVSLMGTLTPTPPPTPCCSPRTASAARSIPPIRNHKPTVASLSPYSCLPPPSGALRHPSSHRTHPDSTADLLSALSQEERDLIEPVIALGYPIRRAILALQKTGRQSLGQFLSYLSACDRLLKQGYEEGQVEEAMEMFQYSEKKAAEFLHLLVQFKDMGFQQAEIKEVLLLCENHRDKALEELMTRTQGSNLW
ncbi:unnamed protein product [Caretta caretta]